MSKLKNGSGPKKGRYQTKRELGTVPVFVSQQTRAFMAAAHVGGEKLDLNGARQDHARYIIRVFGPPPVPAFRDRPVYLED